MYDFLEDPPSGPEQNMSEENLAERRKVAQILRDHADRVESGHVAGIVAAFFDREALSTVTSWLDDELANRQMGTMTLMVLLLSGKIGVRWFPSVMNPGDQQSFGS